MKSQGHRFDRIVAAGGGAKSRLWLEIKASIYNRPILVPSETECGVVGCGMLAGCASGLFTNLDAVIAQQVRYDGTISPNPAWTERYAKMQSLFDDLYASSGQFWDRFEV
jgi:xylulokinase